MQAELKFLKEFYIKKKWHKANSSILIDVDQEGTPMDSVWYEQLRFEKNKDYFELKSLTQKNK
ncbi:MAG: hypothetical protein ACJAY9_000783 [Flavobacteriales bacterium]|jgi:hypothetical protein